MPSIDTFDICEKAGCRSKATHIVRHDGVAYDGDRIVACHDHAVWWTRGFNNVRIGTMTLIARRGHRVGRNEYSA